MSTSHISAPPGRAGRLWLVQRLTVARRAADLLDRKLRILSRELARLRERSESTRQDWVSQCSEADRWLLRAVMLGGERAIEAGAAAGSTEVTVAYTQTMGIEHPRDARCAISEPGEWEGATVTQARHAYGAALAAAVQHAAASAASAAVQAEADITRYRLRAVRDRWIPQLQEALTQTELSIEELERADAARLRRAGARHPADIK